VRRLRLATRASPLARAQSGLVARALERTLGVETELVVLTTSGDRIRDRSLAALGGKGLFVKELEEALLAQRADLAVHSAKDLPARLAPGLALAAFPERADPRDALVGRRAGTTLASLPQGARVGTGSFRRASQLLLRRPDLSVVPLRGNVGTRLRKLEEEGLDAVLLACAGLARLGLEERIDERLDPADMLPAVGQGTLALEVREDDPLRAELAALDDAPTRIALTAERAFLGGLGGDCTVPLAALAEPAAPGRLRLRGLLASPDGSRVARAELEAPDAEAEAAGAAAAARVRAGGGEAILAALAGAGGVA
jgi:hydroxymethylbilane synthase